MDWDYIRYLLYVKALETSLAMGEEFRNLIANVAYRYVILVNQDI